MSAGIESHDTKTKTSGGVLDEKAYEATVDDTQLGETDNVAIARDLVVTEDDLLEAKELAASYSLEDVRRLMTIVHKRHQHDQNFPMNIIHRIEEFLNNEHVFEQPEKHQQLINEMKIQAALITNNSPYATVRAVVDNHDDPSMPVSTTRAWFIGIIFSAAIAFINAFFSIRFPAIAVGNNVVQLLAYPVGKFMDRTLPDWGITLFGVRHSINPGPFNKKEHMLISLMAAISVSQPYTNNIVWIQYLPQFFNQKWAKNFGYQIMVALSTNFIGYGLAGLCRRFLVYPSYCVWPVALVTVALNSAFHDDSNPSVPGPFKSISSMSRFKFFAIAFAAMFFYFWIPNLLFNGLALFSWMTWISPNNKHLSIITGSRKGLGLNPFPTFDWNIVTADTEPLIIPFFTTLNLFTGVFFFLFVVMGIYYTNAYHSAYFPIITNAPFDRFARPYNISMILDDRGILDPEKYHAYSPPYIAAGNIVTNFSFFTIYTAALTYGFIYHREDIFRGFKSLFDSFRPSKKQAIQEGEALDIHNRLMKSYREVPEWWYLIVLAISIALGCTAIGYYPTYTTPAVVPYGIILCLIFVVPTGIIFAMTGIEVSLNVLAEFIGGSWVEGNALAMCYFKTYGYITCSHALHFCMDLKLAHYLKIPPRFTFFAQMIPTLVSTFICVGVVQFQMNLKDVCTPAAPFQFICVQQTSFFTSAVLWGTVGPKRLWGTNGTYAATLAGFPVGICVVLFFWGANKVFPRNAILRSVHPVVILFGGCLWNPLNLTFMWPAVPVACFSWLFIKVRYLDLWAKYNYILSAAFSSGIAISALIQFFGLTYNNISLDWWGNRVIAQGCEVAGCRLKTLAPGEYFGPGPGEFR